MKRQLVDLITYSVYSSTDSHVNTCETSEEVYYG